MVPFVLSQNLVSLHKQPLLFAKLFRSLSHAVRMRSASLKTAQHGLTVRTSFWPILFPTLPQKQKDQNSRNGDKETVTQWLLFYLCYFTLSSCRFCVLLFCFVILLRFLVGF